MKPLDSLFNLILQSIPLLLTFLLAASSYWVAIQSESSLFGLSRKTDPTTSDYYLRNFSVQSHNLAENKYSIIRGKFAQHIPLNNVWNITTPELEQFEPNHATINSHATRGIYKLNTDEVFLQDNVIVNTRSNGFLTTMKSNEVRINNVTGDISAHSGVKVTRQGQWFEANTVTLNNNTGTLHAQGAVQFQIEAKP